MPLGSLYPVGIFCNQELAVEIKRARSIWFTMTPRSKKPSHFHLNAMDLAFLSRGQGIHRVFDT